MRDDAQPATPQGPHPLAVALAAELHAGDRVLLLGNESGRNLGPFENKGIVIEVARDGEAPLAAGVRYAGILSTHALLHGTRASVARRVARLVRDLQRGGFLHATFGSTADPRQGVGTFVAGEGWAPLDGAEAGVAHAYFDREGLERLLIPFDATLLEERDVSSIVGRWAHPAGDAGRPSIHWFVRARLRTASR